MTKQFRFNPAQLTFINAVREVGLDRQNPHRRILFDGGAGSGKTKAIAYTLREYARYYAQKEGRGFRPLLISKSIGLLKRTVLRSLEEWLPNGLRLKVGNSSEMAFSFEGQEHVFFFLPGGKHGDADSMKSINADLSYIEEASAVLFENYEEALLRARTGHRLTLLATNPAYKSHYLYQEFIKDKPIQTLDFGYRKCNISIGNSTIRIPTSMFDNAEINGGSLSNVYIQGLLNNRSDNYVKRMVLGEWLDGGGNLFSEESLSFYDPAAYFSRVSLQDFAENAWVYVDPATAGSSLSCFCAVILMYHDQRNDRYKIVDVRLAKREEEDLYIDDMVAREIDSFKLPQIRKVIFEGNFGQDKNVANPYRQKNPSKQVFIHTQREDKIQRISSYETTIKRRVDFPEDFTAESESRHGFLFLQQLYNFSDQSGKKKSPREDEMLDGVDALAGVLQFLGAEKEASVPISLVLHKS